MDIALFRQAYPAFLDPSCFPATEVQYWATLAAKLHDVGRWGDLLEDGIMLFVAHNLAMEAASTKGGNGMPGAVVGAITAASVDKVSYSRDASSVMDPKNGHWNLTTYGLRWVRLVRMVGAGPVQVGTPGYSQTGSIAWPGVIPPIHG